MTGDTGERGPARGRPADTPSGQVRIVGAARAADIAGEAAPAAPEEAPQEGEPFVPDAFGPEDWDDLEEPALPHWTEAPTGEVPAVLARPDDEPRLAGAAPSWREDPGDWDLDAFSGSILGEGGPGGLADADLSERQPWSFELGGDEAEGEELDEFGDLDELDALDDAAGPGLFEAWRHGPAPLVDEDEDEDEDEAVDDVEDDVDPFEASGSGAATGAPSAEEPEPDELGDLGGGEAEEGRDDRTATLPRTDAAAGAPAPAPGDLDEEAAALAADLQAHGFGRRWRRGAREVTSAGARHRARPSPAPAAAPPSVARRAEEAVSARAGRNVPVAVATGVVIGAITLVAFRFGTVPSMVVVTAVLGLAAVEAYGAFRRAGYRPVTVLGLAAVVAVLVGSYDRTFEAIPAVVVVLVAATLSWHLLRVDPKAEPVRSASATLFVFCWVGVLGAFAALLLSPSLFPDRHGIAYLLGALICSVAYDVGALAVGAGLGRHPLTSVSPGKTWEGVVGGAVAAVVLGVAVVRLIHPWTLGEAAALGVVVAVVSPLGDLCESLVKRHLGLKDMGRILPGHGGLLDRLDGLLFVLPATYYLLRAFGHG